MENAMRILMTLSNPFTHDPRVYNEAKSLVDADYEVTVLARDKKNKNPISEVKNRINIERVYNTKFMSMLPYNAFDLYFWWNEGYKDALKLHKQDPFDVVHCHDLNTLPIGIKLKKKLGLPLIYDAHEIWGYMVSRGMSWWKYYIWKEKHIIKHVDRIITVNEPLKTYFNNFTNKPVTIIMNCKPLQNKTYEPPNNKKFTLLYIGTLGKSRYLLELADVVEELPDVKCIIAGSAMHEYVDLLKNKCSKIQNVDFIGRVPRENVLPMTKKADAVICMTSPFDPNNSRATANKQFEAMVCARPIICTKGTYPGIFTEKYNCGLTAEYNKQSLKEAIIKLRDNPKLCKELGKNSLKAAIKGYNWKKQEEKLMKTYKEFEK